MTSSVDFEALRPSPADVRVLTSDGSAIAAHSPVLVSADNSLFRFEYGELDEHDFIDLAR